MHTGEAPPATTQRLALTIIHLRRLLVDSPNSLGAKARARRAERFIETFPDLEDARVIDLGGTIDFWQRLPFRPLRLTTLNLWEDANAYSPDVDWHVDRYGDACDPPDDVTGESYDLVFSNSTIEHVGDRGRRQMFADVVRKLADRHWIQTPNRAFPLEPHVLFPGQQFLPRHGRALVERYWPLVHTRRPTMDQALAAADETELIGRKEMTELFPTSVIEDEMVARFLPAKSLIAVRR